MSASQLVPRRQPFVYLALALASGIAIGRVLMLPSKLAILAAIVILFVAILRMWRSRGGLTVLLLIACAVSGITLSSVESGHPGFNNIRRVYEAGAIPRDEEVEITGVLVHAPEPSPAFYYLDLAVETVQQAGQSRTVSGNLKLAVPNPDTGTKEEFQRVKLDFGSRMRARARLAPAHTYHNPGSPDFDEFLEREGYDLGGFIKNPRLIENLGSAGRNPLLAFLYRMRARVMDSIDLRFEPKLAGMLKAILVGNRYFIEAETARRLKEGGTFHTLVIAGLHVGIIAGFLLASGRLRRNPLWIALSIVILWAYATMTGLAPPVVRATTMITIGLIGPLLFRRAASLNTVAIAAFIMLVWNPGLIVDPGFQLSFAAVAGIVGLGIPLIDKLREIGTWRPSSRAPHPPIAPRWFVWSAEVLFWDQRRFNSDMANAPVRYRMRKAPASVWINRLRLQRATRAVMVLMIVSTVIQVSTAPLMILYFNRVSPVGVLLNVTAGFFTATIMSFGCATIALGAVSHWLASYLSLVCSAAGYLLVNSVGPFLPYSWSTWRVPQYEGWYRAAYGFYFIPIVVFAVLLDRWRPLETVAHSEWASPRKKPKRRTAAMPLTANALSVFACALAFVVAWIVVLRPVESLTRGKLTVYFLDVGQGDSALIVFPRGRTMLVDGGGEITFSRPANTGESAGANEGSDIPVTAETRRESRIGESVVSRFLWSLGLRRIDYVVATHSHQDHVGGLFAVLENFNVGELLLGASPQSGSEYLDLATLARARGVPVGRLDAGRNFELDDVDIKVLWPSIVASRPNLNGNNQSLVLRLSYGRESILMAGDIEEPVENSLVRSGVDLRAELLKVPHHGSRTSSSGAFLEGVMPAIGIISVGEPSRFGHPHPEVLSNYSNRGITLYRTSQSGTVTAEIDGNTLIVKTYLH